ncbi:rhodanese-like domain-containing protein [Waterburya agarophytonicola K14]|uniref:Rhodanese-like domain-containing protein n=1 Tax=Waterburya agarophytonicola KI4 TaxID=2874699 RepID=A0A964BTR2_9CYAN|nr:rhodanese-like domain-containing protein [Waterburya agarophytonicola]MCC0178007.1 rhodanese-like domain-containing protein [Waterburya agarophytonicola KI4]
MKYKLLLKQGLITVVGVLIILTSAGCRQTTVAQSEIDKRSQITTMYRKYAEEFPQIESITVEQLQQWQQQGKNIILVDVRTPKERAVSMIPGAIALAEFEENLEQYNDDKAIIVAYCTIGYRSGKYTSKLRQKGINIFNLEGSLLAWSHIQGKLVDRNGFTNKVHVFGHQWQLTADNYQAVW